MGRDCEKGGRRRLVRAKRRPGSLLARSLTAGGLAAVWLLGGAPSDASASSTTTWSAVSGPQVLSYQPFVACADTEHCWMASDNGSGSQVDVSVPATARAEPLPRPGGTAARSLQ